MRRLTLILLAAIAGCGQRAAPPPPPLPEPVITVSGQELLFAGLITRGSPVPFRKAVAENAISVVTIDSPGGDVEAALEIAGTIRDRRLDVKVQGSCMSSCANYIFPSGRRKVIAGGAIVGWHGNVAHMHYLDTTGKGSKDPVIRQHNLSLSAKETEFMRTIGVDPYVAWFGKQPPFNVANFYALTVADMATFGIREVTAPADYGPAYLGSLPDAMRQVVVFVAADAETAARLRSQQAR